MIAQRDKRNGELEARVRELEDVRQIADVQRQWDNMCAGGFNGLETHRTEEALHLLTDDATLEVQGMHDRGEGPKGKVDLRRYFDALSGAVALGSHITSDNRIEVHGDVAYQNADCIGMGQGAGPDDPPRLSFVRYSTELVRTPEGWRIRKLIITNGLGTHLPNPFMASANRPNSGWETGDWFGFAGIA
jgi:hypothetical protein